MGRRIHVRGGKEDTCRDGEEYMQGWGGDTCRCGGTCTCRDGEEIHVGLGRRIHVGLGRRIHVGMGSRHVRMGRRDGKEKTVETLYVSLTTKPYL